MLKARRNKIKRLRHYLRERKGGGIAFRLYRVDSAIILYSLSRSKDFRIKWAKIGPMQIYLGG